MMKKRTLLSWLLVIALALSLFPVCALAEESDALTRAEAAAAAAQDAADAAMTAATEADAVADEAEAIEAEDKSPAADARTEADGAMTAANAAQSAADSAAENLAKTREMVDAGNTTAADIWANAAESNRDNALSQQLVAESKLLSAKAYLESQKIIAAAEEAANAAKEAELAEIKQKAIIELNAAGEEDGHGAPYTDITEAAKAAVEAAETKEDVERIVQDARDAIAARKVCPAAIFRDVNPNRYYHKAVDYMVTTGYMNGMNATEFGVDGTLTRGQLVTILYRVSGSPDASGYEMPFEDVADKRFYTDAVKWAAANGIVTGTSTTTFAPESLITREQIVVILFRWAGAEAPEAEPETLTDLAAVSPYAKGAVAWAVENGIVTGIQTSAGLEFQPKGNATRAQCATILERFLNK